MILAPYTRLHPTTARLLNRHAPGHVRVRIDPADDSAYFRLLAGEWSRPGDLVVVEQDVGLAAGVVSGFAPCREPWCGHAYPVGRRPLICLGCTRFTSDLKSAEPDLFEVVGRCADDGIPARHWRRLDVRVDGELRRRGYTPHRHVPDLAHYHKYAP